MQNVISGHTCGRKCPVPSSADSLDVLGVESCDRNSAVSSEVDVRLLRKRVALLGGQTGEAKKMGLQ